MSLKISNLATEKQIEWLKKLGYDGRGKYAAEKLTKPEAAEILDGLFEQRQEDEFNQDYMGVNQFGN